MQYARSLRRTVLLAATLLSACAASEPGAENGQLNAAGQRQADVFGSYLSGRFAASQTDLDRAATDLLRAYRAEPDNSELLQQAFLASLLDGRPDAETLALKLPDNPAAQLALADQAALAGNWDSAEQRFHALPRQGLTQLLQPLLVAWAQQGAGRTDAALATLAPFVSGARFQGVYALHAAMIADLAGKQADAARFYHTAQTEYGGLNLRLAQILASWQARQGHQAEAEATLQALTETSGEMAIAIPAMSASLATRPVASATDGIAESYLALAAALRQQDQTEYALLLLQLALDVRPGFSPARLLMADILDGDKHPGNALKVLAQVGATDPLITLVKLRTASLNEELGNTPEATAALEQLARENPDRPEPLAQLGDLLRLKSRFGEAVTAYDRAIARIKAPTRSDWPLFYDRGIALERSKQWVRAEADFEHALQLSPDEPFVLNYLGYSWTEQGRNLAKARQMIDRAVEQRPNDGSIVDSLGFLMLRQGETAPAIRQLEHAVELEPEDSTINGHLGDAYWAAGRKLEAEYQWRRALTLKPEPDEVSGLEAKLKEAEAQLPGPTTAERKVP